MSFLSKYWDSFSERKQAGIRYAANTLLLVFTVWVTLSVTSYVFTWKQDQSALAAGGTVENAAATTGLSAGHFLVTDSFGLAAFCLVLFLLVWTLKRLWRSCPVNLRKWFYGMLSLSFLLSWILSFAGRFLDMEFAFGGGLGGRAGAALVNWTVFQLGEIITLCILAALCIAFVYTGRLSAKPSEDRSANQSDSHSAYNKTAVFIRRYGKLFFYIYYPAHLLVLAILRLF